MSRIGPAFAGVAARGGRALIPFVMAGDPDPATTERLIPAMAEAGADLVELGIPFSDPIADGPVNQRAGARALAHGMNLDALFALIRRSRERTQVPLVLLSYYNLLLQYGLDRFCRTAVEAGLDGLVVPDLPADEGQPLVAAAGAAALDTIFLVAPTSTEARMRLAAERSTGFIYCVSLTGVTGVRQTLAEGLRDLVARMKAHSRLPVAVGFGISTPEQAREVAAFADGIIVGSALVALMEKSAQPVEDACRFVRDLKAAISPP